MYLQRVYVQKVQKHNQLPVHPLHRLHNLQMKNHHLLKLQHLHKFKTLTM